jgi:hypothetical protein
MCGRATSRAVEVIIAHCPLPYALTIARECVLSDLKGLTHDDVGNFCVAALLTRLSKSVRVHICACVCDVTNPCTYIPPTHTCIGTKYIYINTLYILQVTKDNRATLKELTGAFVTALIPDFAYLMYQNRMGVLAALCELVAATKTKQSKVVAQLQHVCFNYTAEGKKAGENQVCVCVSVC